MGKYQKKYRSCAAYQRDAVSSKPITPAKLVRKTDKEYCTKTHSSLVITPANGLFHWFSQSRVATMHSTIW